MAFFCTKTGVRIVAPGVSKGAGGDIAEYDGDDSGKAAEMAAQMKLAEMAKADNEALPSAEAQKAAAIAAEEELTKPRAEKARNK